MSNFKALAGMIRDAEDHADSKSDERISATEYYRGIMRDFPADKGRSKVTSRLVRQQIKKAMPSIMRTLFGSDEVVEFLPVGQEDEEGAQQASDYLNFVILPEVGIRKVAFDAVHDALLLQNGIVRWFWDERRAVKVSRHTGLLPEEVEVLAAEDGAEITSQSEYPETIEIEGQQVEVMLYDVTLRRTYTEKRAKVCAVPRERFLIDADASEIEDALLVGEKTTVTRSELVSMGYDRKMVDDLTLADEDDEESRRDDVEESEEARANQPIDYYELYVRIDWDDDGISELRHMCLAGGLSEKNLLVNDECDEVQFADLTAMPQPHQWEGSSLADDLMDLQRVQTALWRQTLDNIYWQNNQQPIVQLDAVQNPESVMNPAFGMPIILKQGRNAQEVVQFSQVPFVAAQSFQMLEYIDNEAQDRTGINDASSGLAADALQNMTAKASAMIEQGGIGQTEMMVRNLAEGFRKLYRGLLRLTIRHQDKPRVVRLRDEWVEFDPRHWNSEMDAVVNVGLGAGTRERDMQVMQIVMGVQEKLIAAFGPDNPFVTPENMYAALSKMVEAAGLKTPSLFFNEPDPEQVAARLEAMRNQPDPEVAKAQAKAQADAQMKQADIQAKMALEDKKMQVNAAKERAQMDADLRVKQAEIEAESIRQAQELQSNAAIEEQRIQWEREKFAQEMAFKREEMSARRTDEAYRMTFGQAAE